MESPDRGVHPLLTRLGTEFYDKRVSRARRLAETAILGGDPTVADLSVSVPSPGFTAAGMRFNPIMQFHSEGKGSGDEALASLRSMEDLSGVGSIMLYDVRQPGTSALLPDGRFNPSLVYGRSIKKSEGNYTDVAYRNVEGANGIYPEKKIETRFSGKLLLATEDFALWTPNARWEESKTRRGGPVSELVTIPKARVVAIPWIQTNNGPTGEPGGEGFMQPSFASTALISGSSPMQEDLLREERRLHIRLLEKAAKMYAVRVSETHIARKDLYEMATRGRLTTLPDQGPVVRLATELFSGDLDRRELAERVFETDGLGLFGYERTSSTPIEDDREFTDFNNARIRAETLDGRKVDKENRVYSSCCTPFVGKVMAYQGTSFMTEDRNRFKPGLLLMVKPLILSLPCWLRPRDEGTMTGLSDLYSRTDLTQVSHPADGSIDATTIHTKYLDLPNVNYTLTIWLDQDKLRGQDGSTSNVHYMVNFPHVNSIEVNEASLGDEEKAYHRVHSRNARRKLINTRDDGPSPDTGVYDPSMSPTVRTLVRNLARKFDDTMEGFETQIDFLDTEKEARFSTPQGSVLLTQALNSLIEHVSSAGDALAMRIGKSGSPLEEVHRGSSTRYVTAKTIFVVDGAGGGSDFMVYDEPDEKGQRLLNRIPLSDVNIEIELDAVSLARGGKSTREVTNAVRIFMEVLSALCATERGISGSTTGPAEVGTESELANTFFRREFTPRPIPFDLEGGNYGATSTEGVALLAYMVQQTHESIVRAAPDADASHMIDAVRAWTSEPATAYTGGMSPFLARYLEMGGAYARNIIYPKFLDFGVDSLPADFSTAGQRLRLHDNQIDRYFSANPDQEFVPSTDLAAYRSVVYGDPPFIHTPRALMSPPGVPLQNRTLRPGSSPLFPGGGSILERRFDPFGYATPHGAIYTMLEEFSGTSITDSIGIQRVNLFSDIGNAFSVHVRPDVFSLFLVPTPSAAANIDALMLPGVVDAGGDESRTIDSLADAYGTTIAINHSKEPYALDSIRRFYGSVAANWRKITRLPIAPPSARSTIKRENWVATFANDDTYALIDNPGRGECFFYTVQQALSSRGETIGGRTFTPGGDVEDDVAFLRGQVADNLTQDLFETYKFRYDMAVASGNASELSAVGFMRNVDSLGEMEDAVQQCGFWANETVIQMMEGIYGIKVIVMDQAESSRGIDKTISCGPRMDEDIFAPKWYMIVSLENSDKPGEEHFELVEHEGNRTFSFDEIPDVVKRHILNQCMGTQGAYDIIPDFSRAYIAATEAVASEAFLYESGVPVRVYTTLNMSAPLIDGSTIDPELDDPPRSIVHAQLSMLHAQKYAVGSLRANEDPDTGNLRHYLSFVPAIPLFSVPDEDDDDADKSAIEFTMNQAVRVMEEINDPMQEAPTATFFVVPDDITDRQLQLRMDALGQARFSKSMREDVLTMAANQGVLVLERKLTRNLGSSPTSYASSRAYPGGMELVQMAVKEYILERTKGAADVSSLFGAWKTLYRRGFEDRGRARRATVSGYAYDPKRTLPARAKPKPSFRRPTPSPAPSPAPAPAPGPRPSPVPAPIPRPSPVTPVQPRRRPRRRPRERVDTNAPTAREIAKFVKDAEDARTRSSELVLERGLRKESGVVQALAFFLELYDDDDILARMETYQQAYEHLEEVEDDVSMEAPLYYNLDDLQDAVRTVNLLWRRGKDTPAFEDDYREMIFRLRMAQNEIEVEEQRTPPAPVTPPRTPLTPARVDLDPRAKTSAELNEDLRIADSILAQLNAVPDILKDKAKDVEDEANKLKNALIDLRGGDLQRSPGGARVQTPFSAYEKARIAYDLTPTTTVEETILVNNLWNALEPTVTEMNRLVWEASKLLRKIRTESGLINYPAGIDLTELEKMDTLMETIPARFKEIVEHLETSSLDPGRIERILEPFRRMITAQSEVKTSTNWTAEFQNYRRFLLSFESQVQTLGSDSFDAGNFYTAWNNLVTLWNDSFVDIFTTVAAFLNTAKDAQDRYDNVLKAEILRGLQTLTNRARQRIESAERLADGAAQDERLDARESSGLATAAASVTSSIESVGDVAARERQRVSSASSEAAAASEAAADKRDEITDIEIQQEAQRMLDLLIQKRMRGEPLSEEEAQKQALLLEIIGWKEGDRPLSQGADELAEDITARLGELPVPGSPRASAGPAAVALVRGVSQTADVSTPDARTVVEDLQQRAREEADLALARAEAERAALEAEEQRLRREAFEARRRARQADDSQTMLRTQASAMASSALGRLGSRFARAADRAAFSQLMGSFGGRLRPPPAPITPPSSPAGPAPGPIAPPLVPAPIDDGDIMGATREPMMEAEAEQRVQGGVIEFSGDVNYSSVVVTQEQMMRRQSIFPIAPVEGYGSYEHPLRLEISATLDNVPFVPDDEIPAYQKAVVYPIVVPLNFPVNGRPGIVGKTLASVGATFLNGDMMFSVSVDPSGGYRTIVGTQKLMRKFPISGVITVTVGRSDMTRFDPTTRLPLREDTPIGEAARAYSFSMKYSLIRGDRRTRAIAPGTPLASMTEIVGQRTPDPEGGPFVSRLSPPEPIAQLHLSGVTTYDPFFVELRSFLFAFPANSQDTFDWYKTL
jgi:hypothetical protein